MALGRKYAHNRPVRPALAPGGRHERGLRASPEPDGLYFCPMHPEVVRERPGACPVCGMALEPRVASGPDDHPELAVMTRRLLSSAMLTVPLLVLAMAGIALLAHQARRSRGNG